MPFAKKYSKHMKFPKEGDKINDFTIELVKVKHTPLGSGRYEYPTEITAIGRGGKKGVRDTFKQFFDQKITLFSGYGNPYQCQGGKMEIESLGENKYRIRAQGSCTRIFLKRELEQFLQHLMKNNLISGEIDTVEIVELIENYMKMYIKKTRI
jgi:hypothetical protein